MGEKGTDSGGRNDTTSALMNQPIVMDVGTATTKAGFAGGAKPKVRLFGIMVLPSELNCFYFTLLYLN